MEMDILGRILRNEETDIRLTVDKRVLLELKIDPETSTTLKAKDLNIILGNERWKRLVKGFLKGKFKHPVRLFESKYSYGADSDKWDIAFDAGPKELNYPDRNLHIKKLNDKKHEVKISSGGWGANDRLVEVLEDIYGKKGFLVDSPLPTDKRVSEFMSYSDYKAYSDNMKYNFFTAQDKHSNIYWFKKQKLKLKRHDGGMTFIANKSLKKHLVSGKNLWRTLQRRFPDLMKKFKTRYKTQTTRERRQSKGQVTHDWLTSGGNTRIGKFLLLDTKRKGYDSVTVSFIKLGEIKMQEITASDVSWMKWFLGKAEEVGFEKAVKQSTWADPSETDKETADKIIKSMSREKRAEIGKKLRGKELEAFVDLFMV